MVTALEKLEQVAKRAGWRLRWKAAPLASAPSMTCTELDIFEGKRLLTRESPVWTIHGPNTPGRESVARTVLQHLVRRGAGQSKGPQAQSTGEVR